MKLDTRQKVLLALYFEYQKDRPHMENVTYSLLGMDEEVFYFTLKKLSNEGYITDLVIYSADNDEFYTVDTRNVSLTGKGIDHVETKFGTQRFKTTEEKVEYMAKECGKIGLRILKSLGLAALEHIHDIF